MVKCVVFMCLQGHRNVRWSLLIGWFALRTYPDSGLMVMCFWRSKLRACLSFLCYFQKKINSISMGYHSNYPPSGNQYYRKTKKKKTSSQIRTPKTKTKRRKTRGGEWILMLTLKQADVRLEYKARVDLLCLILGQTLTGS